jgi:putative transposase
MLALLTTTRQALPTSPVTRRCQALTLSRATYDRGQAAEPVPDSAVALRAHLQAIAMAMPAYGYRRITQELHRRGLVVNHKRVVRLLREDNGVCATGALCGPRTPHLPAWYTLICSRS